MNINIEAKTVPAILIVIGCLLMVLGFLILPPSPKGQWGAAETAVSFGFLLVFTSVAIYVMGAK